MLVYVCLGLVLAYSVPAQGSLFFEVVYTVDLVAIRVPDYPSRCGRTIRAYAIVIHVFIFFVIFGRNSPAVVHVTYLVSPV